jgi:hypothetical protein
MSRADSILQTASIARWVSVAATATDHTIFNPSPQDGGIGPQATAGCRASFFVMSRVRDPMPHHSRTGTTMPMVKWARAWLH